MSKTWAMFQSFVALLFIGAVSLGLAYLGVFHTLHLVTLVQIGDVPITLGALSLLGCFVIMLRCLWKIMYVATSDKYY